MADLTSSIQVSGTINGKVFSFTHEYVLENVYDAGTLDRSTFREVDGLAANAGVSGIGPMFPQAAPDYIFAKNSATSSPYGLTLNSDTGSISTTIDIHGNGFVIMPTPSTGGNFGKSATDTDFDLDDLSSLDMTSAGLGFTGLPSVLVAFNTAS